MKKYLSIIFSLLLVAYIVVALTFTSSSGTDARCSGMKLIVENSSDNRFVTADELIRELDSLPLRAKGMKLSDINPWQLRKRLMDIDKIEDAQITTFTDGSVEIRVTPIIPVARVFDGSSSYYINRSGKRITANARYHKDVPLISGHFPDSDSLHSPMMLLPLVDYISADSLWSRFITMIEVKPNGDVILVPTIREHVINIGQPDDLDDKFSRLHRFYNEVLSRRGYESYDTLSLKWRGQLVASRRKKSLPAHIEIPVDDEEAVDTTVMLAGANVAPGQTLPGVKAHDEKPIPKKKTS